jgi:hypothetical protein
MSNEVSLQDVLSVNQVIDDLTLLDDDLLRLVFDGNIPATELLLKIILQRDDIRVISVVGQRELENPLTDGRNIRVDILAADSTGRQFNIEIQKKKDGAHFRRARFHSSALDARMLKASQKFHEIQDSYVIFITEKDVIGAGLPLYHMERVIEETGEFVGDGSHIVYVNGSYKGDDPIGRLVHDFRCKDPDDMYYEELSRGVQHFKGKGGNNSMSELLEKYAQMKADQAVEKATKETAEKQQFELIRNLMDSMQWSLDQAMNALKITGEARETLLKRF